VEDGPSEPDGFRDFVQARGPAGWRPRWNRGWAPAMAAASVIVVAAASAGIAAALSSRHGRQTAPPSTSASVSSVPSQPVTPTDSAPAKPTWPPRRVAGGMWGAELINRQTFNQGSLASGPGSLYAISQGHLDRISPATGNVLASTPYNPPVPNPPVVIGGTVWVVASYDGGVVLDGYNGDSLAQVASVAVPVSGRVSASAQGVLTSGSDGYLYVAVGNGVAVVNPQTRQVIKRISVSGGPVTSVAVAPNGSRLYVSVGQIQLVTYDPVTGAQLSGSGAADLASTAGHLVATQGGVWLTTGVGMAESVWFAPGGDLTRLVRVGQGVGAGLASIPTFSGDNIWIGGTQDLMCANPDTGQVRASTVIPRDNGVVGYLSSVTIVGDNGYALYMDQAAHGTLRTGIARLTPPAACGGWMGYSPGPS
jgi:hypothetical protein